MDKYECLLKVIEYGSFAEAAKALNYTQPAVSHTINTLESELQIQLFVRSRHGLQLTYEGAQILPYIRDLVKAQNAVYNHSLLLRNSRSGLIKIATFGTFVNNIFPNILQTFHLKYPNVIFDFHQGYYREIENWVIKDSVDIGITSLDNINERLTTIPLFEDPFYLALPATHVLASRKSFSLEELIDCDSINALITLDEGEDRMMLAQLGDRNIPPILYQFCSYEGILASVALGLGAAIVPELAFHKSQENISCIPISPEEKRTIGIVYKESNSGSFSPYTMEFMTCLREQIQTFSEKETA